MPAGDLSQVGARRDIEASGWPGVLALAAFVASPIVILLMVAGIAYATLQSSTSVGDNVSNTDTLDPPTALVATGGASINLAWTATLDLYASGYRVLRGTAAGGPYTQIAEVTPRTAVTYTDNPAAGTYYYVARGFYQNWESINSVEASATKNSSVGTGFANCSLNSAVVVSSGDNNGFQLNPANGCADGGGFAEDTNSGNTTATTCASTGKDRHLFYNYGFGVPTGSNIEGVEVSLDAWADSAAAAPFICVELSWDAGVSWTAAKTTSTLGTTEATRLLGTGSDTWGRTWTPLDFANATFRVRITDVSSSNARDFRLDRVAVQVTYTPP